MGIRRGLLPQNKTTKDRETERPKNTNDYHNKHIRRGQFGQWRFVCLFFWVRKYEYGEKRDYIKNCIVGFGGLVLVSSGKNFVSE